MVCRLVGRCSVVDGLVENPSVGRWSVVGGLWAVEDLSVDQWLVVGDRWVSGGPVGGSVLSFW